MTPRFPECMYEPISDSDLPFFVQAYIDEGARGKLFEGRVEIPRLLARECVLASLALAQDLRLPPRMFWNMLVPVHVDPLISMIMTRKAMKEACFHLGITMSYNEATSATPFSCQISVFKKGKGTTLSVSPIKLHLLYKEECKQRAQDLGMSIHAYIEYSLMHTACSKLLVSYFGKRASMVKFSRLKSSSKTISKMQELFSPIAERIIRAGLVLYRHVCPDLLKQQRGLKLRGEEGASKKLRNHIHKMTKRCVINSLIFSEILGLPKDLFYDCLLIEDINDLHSYHQVSLKGLLGLIDSHSIPIQILNLDKEFVAVRYQNRAHLRTAWVEQEVPKDLSNDLNMKDLDDCLFSEELSALKTMIADILTAHYPEYLMNVTEVAR